MADTVSSVSLQIQGSSPSFPSSQGYHKLATLMGNYRRVAIFRRFGALNMLNLLSLQAELVELEVHFKDVCAEDNESNDPVEQNFSKYFHELRKSENKANDEQYQMLLTLRKKLQEYSMSPLSFVRVCISRWISLTRDIKTVSYCKRQRCRD